MHTAQKMRMCSDCGGSDFVMECSDCGESRCSECNRELEIFFECYICKIVTCEDCGGNISCDYCGGHNSYQGIKTYICRDHSIAIKAGRTACYRKECHAIADYINCDLTDSKLWKRILDNLKTANTRTALITDLRNKPYCGVR